MGILLAVGVGSSLLRDPWFYPSLASLHNTGVARHAFPE